MRRPDRHRLADVRPLDRRSSLIGLAAAAHQGWSANIFTMASDMFPKRAVGSVVGLGGMAGAAGSLLSRPSSGYILQHTHNNYLIPFLISGSAYLVALSSSSRRLPPGSSRRPLMGRPSGDKMGPAPTPAGR